MNNAEYFESHGFKREIAGAEFDRALKALDLMANHRMGLFISGTFGIGKTLVATLIASRFSKSPKFINLANPDINEWLLNRDLVTDSDTRTVILDDLGEEQPVMRDYIKREPAVDFLRHRFMQTRIPPTIITTNLSQEDFIARYGGRLVSHLKTHCIFWKMQGEDKRKVITV